MSKTRRMLLGALAAVAMAGAASADPPKGWGLGGNRPGDYETGVEQSGRGKVAYIRAKTAQAAGFATLMQTDTSGAFVGKRLRLSALMKTGDATAGQMWMRVDGPGEGRARVLAFDNMDSRPVTGTTDWKRYEVVLDVPVGATGIAYGFFLRGKGEVWADDFKLEAVGANVPVTGGPIGPRNLSFEESRRQEGEDGARA
jgi:hypothetical protein